MLSVWDLWYAPPNVISIKFSWKYVPLEHPSGIPSMLHCFLYGAESLAYLFCCGRYLFHCFPSIMYTMFSGWYFKYVVCLWVISAHILSLLLFIRKWARSIFIASFQIEKSVVYVLAAGHFIVLLFVGGLGVNISLLE